MITKCSTSRGRGRGDVDKSGCIFDWLRAKFRGSASGANTFYTNVASRGDSATVFVPGERQPLMLWRILYFLQLSLSS